MSRTSTPVIGDVMNPPRARSTDSPAPGARDDAKETVTLPFVLALGGCRPATSKQRTHEHRAPYG